MQAPNAGQPKNAVPLRIPQSTQRAPRRTDLRPSHRGSGSSANEWLDPLRPRSCRLASHLASCRSSRQSSRPAHIGFPTRVATTVPRFLCSRDEHEAVWYRCLICRRAPGSPPGSLCGCSRALGDRLSPAYLILCSDVRGVESLVAIPDRGLQDAKFWKAFGSPAAGSRGN